jgi:chromosome segregation ATPase
VQKDLSASQTAVKNLTSDLETKGKDNERLRRALESYRHEVTSMENLITRLQDEHDAALTRIESEHQGSIAQLRCELDEAVGDLDDRLMQRTLELQTTSSRLEAATAESENRAAMITELEKRLGDAIHAAEQVQTETKLLLSAKDTQIAALQREHGDALAVRDGQIAILESEISMLRTSLASVQENVNRLTAAKKELEAELGGRLERLEEAEEVMWKMRDLVDEFGSHGKNGSRASGMRGVNGRLAKPALLFQGEESKKRRRKYDSGLGFLEEDGEEQVVLVG